MVHNVDIVCGLAWGDEAKGKISAHLAKTVPYDYVARWGGGNNAGHTVFVNGHKYVTHLIPSGVFYGIPSIVGPGCVVHPESFLKEIKYLDEHSFNTNLVKVHPNAHIVLDEHINFDKDNLAGKLGTTSRGIAPAYAAKYARTGILAKDVLDSRFIFNDQLSGNVLCEGAQGVWLDINHGNYPYVTSSETLPYAACSLGFSPRAIRNIYGAAKVYDTRSGEDPVLFPESLLDDPELSQVAKLGSEFGSTTGRPRKVNWLNLNALLESIKITGTNIVVLSKLDVLEELGFYKLYHNGQLVNFQTQDKFRGYIENAIYNHVTIGGGIPLKIIFSNSPHEI